MNISYTVTRKVLLYLFFLMVPLLSQAQFYKFFEVLVNDSLSYEFESIQFAGNVSTAPTHGQAQVVPGSGTNLFDLIYTPNANYIGRDTLVITYYVYPITPRQRTIEVEVLPSFVKAKQDFASTSVDASVTFFVLDNDQGSSVLSLSNVSLVNDGTVTINPDNSITFQPSLGFSGEAHFNYTVCVDSVTCDVGVATVFVRNLVAAVDTIRLATRRGIMKELTLPLDNGYQRILDAGHGTLNEVGDGLLEYQPDNNFYGDRDTFVYAYNTNAVTSLAVFIIDVFDTPLVNPQGIAKNDFAYVVIDGEVDIDVLANDNQILHPYISLIGQQPNNGVATILNGKINYTPNAGFTGVDKLKYKACIQPVGCENAEVYIIVDNQYPSTTTYPLITPENTPLVINYQIPIEDFDFAISYTESDEGGIIDYYPGNFNGFIHGQQVIGYNLVVYTPPSDYTGIDKFEFQYCVDNDCQLVKIDMDVVAMPNSPIDTFCVAACVWSGDANNDGTVDINDILPIGYCVGEVGNTRVNGSVDWYGQYGDNWNGRISQTEVNLKHVDTNGDGFITASDTLALSEHYGLSHNLTPGPDPVSSNLPLFFVPQSPGPYNPGDLVLVDIILGSEAQPALDMSGLTFVINYNNDIVEPGTFEVNFEENNWMSYNSPMLNMSKYPQDGRVEIGYTRTSSVTSSGYGKIGSLGFVVIDDIIDGTKVGDTIQTKLNVPTPTAMNGLGIYEHLPPFYLDVPITLPGKDPFGLREDQLLVYPNPTEDVLNVHVNGKNEIRELFIYTLTGQRLHASGKLYSKNTQIDLSHFKNGLYLVNVITDKGVITKKVEVMRN